MTTMVMASSWILGNAGGTSCVIKFSHNVNGMWHTCLILQKYGSGGSRSIWRLGPPCVNPKSCSNATHGTVGETQCNLCSSTAHSAAGTGSCTKILKMAQPRGSHLWQNKMLLIKNCSKMTTRTSSQILINASDGILHAVKFSQDIASQVQMAQTTKTVLLFVKKNACCSMVGTTKWSESCANMEPRQHTVGLTAVQYMF